MNIDDFEIMLDALCEEIPREFYDHLQQGVILLEEIKYHPKSNCGDLVILGEYVRSPLGSHIRIFYGSFVLRFGYLSDEALRKEVRSTLIHEFRHHVEYLSGDRSLEVEDEVFLAEYLKQRGVQ